MKFQSDQADCGIDSPPTNFPRFPWTKNGLWAATHAKLSPFSIDCVEDLFQVLEEQCCELVVWCWLAVDND